MMFLKSLLIAFFSITITIAAVPAAAVAADKAVQEKKAEDHTALKTDNPYLSKFEQKSKQFATELGGEELKHLYHIRESFGAIQAIKIVRRDVSSAVKACGKANPDLKASMNERFSSWTATVDPAVKTKEAEIESAILAQTYTKPKEIKDYLKLIEQTADYANRQIDKRIVTTPEACNGLLQSMDKTERVVTDLVADMALVPWPPEQTSESAGEKAATPD
jgi:hypothetical protein